MQSAFVPAPCTWNETAAPQLQQVRISSFFMTSGTGTIANSALAREARLTGPFAVQKGGT